MRGKLILISGPSGVGKGTIRKEMKFNNYVYSISSTTRSKRPGEVHGVDYFFISKEDFVAKVERNEMLEYAEFVGNYYGTDQNAVEQLLSEGKNVCLEIECVGALQVLEKMPEAISIFILPPSIEELKKRLINRGTDDIIVIEKRLKKADDEISLKGHYKYNVINDELERVSAEIDAILEKETRV